MKNYTLTFLGILFSITGVIYFFMISNSGSIGMILMIFGFLLCLINLIYILNKIHKNRKHYQKRFRNSSQNIT